MHGSRPILRCCFALVGVLATASVSGQEAGETIVKQGTIREDIYLAGRSVEVRAQVEGDVVAAGARVLIEDTVRGDVLAAGGAVTVRGTVEDDVRAAGGSVEIAGNVGDDVIAAGGEVLLARTAAVAGRAWLAGGSVTIAGQVGKGVKAAGNSITLTGQIAADVELTGETIEIGPEAVIRGNLTYYSPHEARIDKAAHIAGVITRKELKAHAPSGPSPAGTRFGLFATLAVAAIVYYLLLPAFSLQTARAIRAAPWPALGLGLAVLATTPLVIVLLLVTVIGIWLALVLMALYFVLLTAGLLTGALALGDLGLARAHKAETPSRAWRIGSIAATFVLLWLLCFIPGIGAVAVFALLVFGSGALALALWRRYASPGG
jgi:cytoskeletal protein CcmA (bactofilin family)